MKKYKYLIYFSINHFHENIDCNLNLDANYLVETKTGIEKIKKYLQKHYCKDSVIIKNIMRLK